MYCEDLSAGTTIKGITFTNGAIDLMMNGAGIYLANSSPEIVNCDFISNTAQGHGGAISCVFCVYPEAARIGRLCISVNAGGEIIHDCTVDNTPVTACSLSPCRSFPPCI